MKRIVIPITLLLAGCAKPPEEIVAANVPVDPYARQSCAELSTLQVQKQQSLSQLETIQRATAQEDSDSMKAIHIPVGSIRGGDKEEEIARTKGELNAIASARQSAGCGA